MHGSTICPKNHTFSHRELLKAATISKRFYTPFLVLQKLIEALEIIIWCIQNFPSTSRSFCQLLSTSNHLPSSSQRFLMASMSSQKAFGILKSSSKLLKHLSRFWKLLPGSLLPQGSWKIILELLEVLESFLETNCSLGSFLEGLKVTDRNVLKALWRFRKLFK